ncbi:MAG: hypothetical protein KDB20_08125 [Microthrixaceae bacterium]|nr:hypothetical protein [Microthrixaceae bacterium]
MAEKIFRVEVPDGQHLGRARGEDGDYRGLLFDADNNLVGHAQLSEVDDTDEDDHRNHRQPPDDDLDLEALVKDLQALVDLAILLAAAAEAAAPHIKRWWNERGRSFVLARRDKAKASLARLSKRLRRRSEPTPDGRAMLVDPVPPSDPTDLMHSYQELRVTMSSTEAQKRFVAALVAREFADAQMRMLHSARIVDADEPVFELEGVVQALTPGQVGSVIEQLLEENPSLIQQDNLAELAARLASAHRALPASLDVPAVRASGIPVDPAPLEAQTTES